MHSWKFWYLKLLGGPFNGTAGPYYWKDLESIESIILWQSCFNICSKTVSVSEMINILIWFACTPYLQANSVIVFWSFIGSWPIRGFNSLLYYYLPILYLHLVENTLWYIISFMGATIEDKKTSEVNLILSCMNRAWNTLDEEFGGNYINKGLETFTLKWLYQI